MRSSTPIVIRLRLVSTRMSTAPDNTVVESFLIEAGELVDGLGAELVALESQPHEEERLNAVFRAFHSIKGGAGFLAVRPMVELSHRAENLLAAARDHDLTLQGIHVDCLLQVLDVLATMLHALEARGTVLPAPPALLEQLDRLLPTSEPAAAVRGAMDDREFEALLDEIHGQGGAPGHRDSAGTVAAAAPDTSVPTGPHPLATVRIDTTRIDALIEVADELVLVRNRLSSLALQGADSNMQQAVDDLDRVTGSLQAAALQMRMQPIGQLFQRFPRIVRDLARQLGKQVVLEQSGSDTTLDRMLVEALAYPLVHLVRNAIDHGIEDPASRLRAGKPAHGTITVDAVQRDQRILIRVRDDGRGMDAEALRKAAVAMGLMSAEQAGALTPDACHALVFRPGLTTSDKISEISGRGVGMDVVKTGVVALGGTVAVESTAGIGTTVQIAIPVKLDIMPVLMVRAGKQALALPLDRVTEVLELPREQLRWRGDGFAIGAPHERTLPLGDLAAWTGAAPARGTPVHIVVVRTGREQLGLLVNEVLGREQASIKPLGAHVRHLPAIHGATITGDGGIALVMDLAALAEHPLPPVLQKVA